MRIATFSAEGRRGVGLIAADGARITPLVPTSGQAETGALAVIQALANGARFPDVEGESLPLETVRLEAPLPKPLRNLWCVGRNYHAHARELATSVFKNNDADPEILAHRVHQGSRVRHRASR